MASRQEVFLDAVAYELAAAQSKHPPMHSLHEAYAVILEELDEFWDEVRAQEYDPGDAGHELIQTAAMCLRAFVELRLRKRGEVGG